MRQDKRPRRLACWRSLERSRQSVLLGVFSGANSLQSGNRCHMAGVAFRSDGSITHHDVGTILTTEFVKVEYHACEWVWQRSEATFFQTGLQNAR